MAIQTLFGSVPQEPTLLEKLKAAFRRPAPAWSIALKISSRPGNRRRPARRARIHPHHRRHRRAHHRRFWTASASASTANWWTMPASSRPHPRAPARNPAGQRTRPCARVAEPPAVVLVVGVNGSGKTTTIGKLAQRFKSEGRSVLLCAADTFRAAAIEQLEIWGERTGTDVDPPEAGQRPERRALRRAAGRQGARRRTT